MSIIASVLVAIVALLHAWFFVLEMMLWRRPLGLRTFGMTAEQAEATAVLASNQGLYNGFLAAELVVGLLAAGPTGFYFRFLPVRRHSCRCVRRCDGLETDPVCTGSTCCGRACGRSAGRHLTWRALRACT